MFRSACVDLPSATAPPTFMESEYRPLCSEATYCYHHPTFSPEPTTHPLDATLCACYVNMWRGLASTLTFILMYADSLTKRPAPSIRCCALPLQARVSFTDEHWQRNAGVNLMARKGEPLTAPQDDLSTTSLGEPFVLFNLTTAQPGSHVIHLNLHFDALVVSCHSCRAGT